VKNTNKKLAQKITKISEKIATLGLSDRKGWKGAATRLENLISEVPEESPVLLEVLRSCAHCLKTFSERNVQCSISAIDAVSEALDASGRFLQETPDDELIIAEAKQALKVALENDSEEEPAEKRNASKVPRLDSGLSLDDVASLLIQLEPGDESELTRLKELLDQVASDPALSEPRLGYIIQASRKVKEILEGQLEQSDVIVAEVGELIERAMDGEDKGEKKEPVQPAEARPENFESLPIPEDADLDLMGEFISEGNDQIAAAEEALLALESDPGDTEAIGTVFRAFHTIKGSSAFLGLHAISEMAHHAESLLSRVRDREIRYEGVHADLALRAVDMLKELIQGLRDALGGRPFPRPEGYRDLMDRLAKTEEDSNPQSPEEARSSSRSPFVAVDDTHSEMESAGPLPPDQAHSGPGNDEEEAKAGAGSATAAGMGAQQRAGGAKQYVESTVRVSTNRLDRLIDMVGELVIAHSMVAQDEVVLSASHYDLLKKVSHTSKIVRELQDISMSMRMIPLKATFQKMARLVRDVARKLGKEVQLSTEGEDTEIDRNMVDVISDPLMHMVRNAVDHGIEHPEEREKAGKPRSGNVRLSAYHSAGRVVLEIMDDGKGLDREAILSKALKRGLVNEGTTLGNREVFNLIFEPGFSTVEKVTDLSGRGVGMDVVKKNIEALRGQVEIQSEPGKGCVFKMSFPLTLAIIDGMVVQVCGETYVIPTTSIIRSIKPDPGDLSTILKQGEVMSVQGKFIPLLRLARLFRVDLFEQDPGQMLVVVVEEDGKRAGLLIDAMVCRQQIVIKTLGELMHDIPGIAGAAIMPNGRVGLILDVGGLIKLSHGGNGERFSQDTRQAILDA